MEDKCVSCGAVIPEGRQVCRQCEGKPNSAEIARMCERIRDIVLDSFNSNVPVQQEEAITVHELLSKIEREVMK